MEERLLEKIEELKLALSTDKRIISLNEKEKMMSESKEVQALSKTMEEAQEKYSLSLSRYGFDGKQSEIDRKALYFAKKNLDEHPLVKDYLASYKIVRELYSKIDEEIFSSFRYKRSCHD